MIIREDGTTVSWEEQVLPLAELVGSEGTWYCEVEGS